MQKLLELHLKDYPEALKRIYASSSDGNTDGSETKHDCKVTTQHRGWAGYTIVDGLVLNGEPPILNVARTGQKTETIKRGQDYRKLLIQTELKYQRGEQWKSEGCAFSLKCDPHEEDGKAVDSYNVRGALEEIAACLGMPDSVESHKALMLAFFGEMCNWGFHEPTYMRAKLTILEAVLLDISFDGNSGWDGNDGFWNKYRG